MSINYFRRREQIELHKAKMATSAPVRIAHEKLAKAYTRPLEATTLPHRKPIPAVVIGPTERARERWEDDGGALRPQRAN